MLLDFESSMLYLVFDISHKSASNQRNKSPKLPFALDTAHVVTPWTFHTLLIAGINTKI